jgi:hypothetical protein
VDNPFLAPASGPPPAQPPLDELGAFREVVIAMRFPLILLGGLGVLGALAMIGFAALAMVGSAGAGPNERWLMVGIASLYGVFGVLYAVPAGLLVRSGVAGLLASAEPEQALVSLRAQLWFWRLSAIYVVGLTAVYVVLLIALVALGALGSF